MNDDAVLWRLRRKIWDYEGGPNEAKAMRVLRKLAARSRERFLRSLTPELRQRRDDRELRSSGFACPSDFA